MGRESYMRKVKEKAVEEEDYQQEDEFEPTPDPEDQMTLHHYMASRGTLIHSSLCSEAIPKKPLRSRRLSRKQGKLRIAAGSNFEVPSSVMDRAQEFRSSLDARFPSIIKAMLRSHVTWGFWLGLPAAFCKMYMPDHDEICILEDEDGEKFETKYLVGKMGLSGGCRGFAIAHNLSEGDAVIYHLVETCKFKVFIVRATNVGEMDADRALSPFKVGWKFG
ncbi:OLC1v1018864C1 [Oldenlandia corymbosa var. corymbosa]|uniref:OLC1v1018864C1 n=1 Tax=Oldenlandia corymbosa var. corymbosa TaxID=529605 RepID=A0AAV1ED05_OLDCO|nr:OLC1v1018864C1 [Oldenlandia corymbosa var. corymbosa]